VHGWTFAEARKRVMETMGIEEDENDTSSAVHAPLPTRIIPESTATVAMPTARVLGIQRELCALPECADAVNHFKSRDLWPHAAKSSLRTHTNLEYFHDGQSIGRYPAIIAPVRDIDGELVTIHVTYLEAGRKLRATSRARS